MPRQPINYETCVIYKIVCLDKSVDYVYVGHTTNFKERKSAHKSRCNNPNYDRKLYTVMRDNEGWVNWVMVQIEVYPCNNRREAELREEYWRVALHAQLNTNRAYGGKTKAETDKSYQEEHKEEILQYQKQYRQDHKEEIAKKEKQFREEHKEKIAEQFSNTI